MGRRSRALAACVSSRLPQPAAISIRLPVLRPRTHRRPAPQWQPLLLSPPSALELPPSPCGKAILLLPPARVGTRGVPSRGAVRPHKVVVPGACGPGWPESNTKARPGRSLGGCREHPQPSCGLQTANGRARAQQRPEQEGLQEAGLPRPAGAQRPPGPLLLGVRVSSLAGQATTWTPEQLLPRATQGPALPYGH